MDLLMINDTFKKLIDENDDGFINRDDAIKVFDKLGERISYQDLDDWIKRVVQNDDGRISLQDLKAIREQINDDDDSSDDDDEIR